MLSSYMTPKTTLLFKHANVKRVLRHAKPCVVVDDGVFYLQPDGKPKLRVAASYPVDGLLLADAPDADVMCEMLPKVKGSPDTIFVSITRNTIQVHV